MTDNKDDKPTTPPAPTPPTWAGDDRRKSKAVFDEHGHVHTTTYSGPDRRKKQQDVLKKEKWAFVNRGVFTAVFFMIMLAYLVNILLAPEIAKIRLQEKKIAEMEVMMAQQQAAQPQAQPQPAVPLATENDDGVHIAGEIHSAIESLSKPIPDVDLSAAPAALAGVVQNFNTLQSSPEGQPVAHDAIDTIKSILFAANGDPERAEIALENAKKEDPSVAAVMGNVDGNDLKAAGLLLALNEFRSNVGSSRPFETDLAVLRKYAGNDPKLQAAIARLAPHAKNGVLNRAKLAENLEAAAGDIVMAKMRGEDASVKQRVMARMGGMFKARRVDDLTSDTPDAIVARAQKHLKENNVPAAMAELKKLDGESANAAAGIIAQGEGTMAAEETSALMTQDIMGGLTGELGEALQNLLQPGGGGGTPYLSPAMRGGSAQPSPVVAP